MKVYLAGPITGLSYSGAVDWRDEAQSALATFGIQGFSPMRHKEYLSQVVSLPHTGPGVMSCQKGIMTRDHNDVITSQALLVNLLGCTAANSGRVSVGTVMELAWAWDRRIPVIAVMEPEGNLHDHPMAREAIGFRVTTLAEAIAVVRSLLCNV